METTSHQAMPAPVPLRILFLHGFTQNPTLFRAKTAALTKTLQKAFPSPKYALHFTYPAAPFRLAPADIPGYNSSSPDTTTEDAPDAWGWWRRKDYDSASGQEIAGGPSYDNRPDLPPRDVVYEGLENGLEVIADAIRAEGPFDGVIGFSQGACAAGMVASLLEGERRKEAFDERLSERSGKAAGKVMSYPRSFLEGEKEGGFVQHPLKFAVVYSGFRAPGSRYAAFYEPRIETPVLHVLGQLDVVVEEKRARGLVEVCEGGEERVVMHPGGHFVPSARPWLDAVVGFVRDCVEGSENDEKKGEKGVARGEEESAEDMDVPF